MRGYPADQIYSEVAFLAYYLHWGLDEILSLDHAERKKWCQEVSRVNEKINENSLNK